MGLARRKTGKASGEGNIGFDGGKPGEIAIQRKEKRPKPNLSDFDIRRKILVAA